MLCFRLYLILNAIHLTVGLPGTCVDHMHCSSAWFETSRNTQQKCVLLSGDFYFYFTHSYYINDLLRIFIFESNLSVDEPGAMFM